jgi:nucleoside-diphosphate-sugar epimerase
LETGSKDNLNPFFKDKRYEFIQANTRNFSLYIICTGSSPGLSDTMVTLFKVPKGRGKFWIALPVSKAVQYLGYQPKFPLQDGLEQTFKWYQDHPFFLID